MVCRQNHSNSCGFDVVDRFCGHGLGKELHMAPTVRERLLVVVYGYADKAPVFHYQYLLISSRSCAYSAIVLRPISYRSCILVIEKRCLLFQG